MNDLMMLKSLGRDDMTPYEQFKTQHMQAKSHTSGIGVAGLVLGTVGTVAAATAWIFGGMQASAKANQAKEAAQSAKEQAATQYAAALQLMNQQNANTNATLDRVIRGLERETDARTAGDINLTATINDSVSGSQQGQLSASQIATNEASAKILADVMTGKYQQSPQRVSLWQEGPCNCPASGCGCNG